MSERKAEARERGHAARRTLDPSQRATLSAEAAARFLALPELAGVRSVLAYSAMPEEIDPAPIVRELLARDVRVAYPRVRGPRSLTLHWATPDELEPGVWGILEPRDSHETADAGEIDLVIVPGVAFDASCCRIGHGGGYYDALLPRIGRHAIAVGLAFDEQVADEPLPLEPHDVRVDAVVTPTRVLRR